MATARAIASGNWSATSTWNGGVLPGNGDTVYSNGFTVTIDQNITIGGANNPIVNAGSFVSGQWYEITSVGNTSFTGIGASANTVGTIFQASGVGSGTGQARALATLTTGTNTAAGATTGGGGFLMPTVYNVNADIRPVTTTCLTVTATTGTVNMEGLIMGFGNSNSFAHGVSNASTATISLTGYTAAGQFNSYPINNNAGGIINLISCTLTGGAGGSNHYAVFNNAPTGTINIMSCILNGGSNGVSTYNNAAGTINITNSTIIGGSAATGFAITNALAGTITITGSSISASTGSAINNSSAGTIICTNCTFTASPSANAISSTNASADIRLSGSFYDATNGYKAVYSPKWRMAVTPTNSVQQLALDGINANSFVRYFTADNSLGQANPTDVRSGVTYASGNLTGRLTVPARGNVSNTVAYGPSMPFTATRSGTTATATLAYSYPLVVGDQVTVTGASNSEWNGNYTIASVVSGTSVTFTVPNTISAISGTGALMQTTGTGVLTLNDVVGAVNTAIASAVTTTINPNVTTTINTAIPTAVDTAMDTQWNKQTTALTVSGSIGARLANASTVATTGQQITAALG